MVLREDERPPIDSSSSALNRSLTALIAASVCGRGKLELAVGIVVQGETGVDGSSYFLFNGFFGSPRKTFRTFGSAGGDFRSSGLIRRGGLKPPETGGVGGRSVGGGGGAMVAT